jgi:O-antigen ligase
MTTNLHFSSKAVCPVLNRVLSWASAVLVILGVVSLLSFYIYTGFQPYRGPTKIYFFLLLGVALISPRVAVLLFIALLPLLPTLHTQLEFILKPTVKYFVAFPAVDAMAGLFIGGWLGRCIRGKRLEAPFSSPPWPLALMLLVVSFSCAVTIARNLWQTASVFSIYDVALSFLNFKLLPRESDYFPISEWVTFSTLTLTVLVLSDYLQKEKGDFEIVFKPLILGLGLSALWGIFQSVTNFGLGEYILIREYFFGFPALGFQPDIHAFGGLMVLGAIGLIGFIWQTMSRRWLYLALAVSLLSWIALIQSKSRASIAIAIIFGLVFLIIRNKRRINIFSGRRRLFSFVVFIVTFLAVIIVGFFTYHITHDKSIRSFDAVNLASSWRLDLFLGALRMWLQFPWLGVGQGNLLRVGSDYDFSGSALMAMLGGENAHNYFLQTLTELGLVGCFVAVCMMVWPTLRQTHPKNIAPVWMAIVALFSGNLYSHSFVIRENLFIFAGLLALLYSSAAPYSITSRVDNQKFTNRTAVYRMSFGWVTLISVAFCIAGFTAIEVVKAFKKIPFQYARKCYNQIENGEWRRGQLFIEIPSRASAVTVYLRVGPGADTNLVAKIDSKLFDRLSTLVYRGELKILDVNEGLLIIKFLLPSGEPIGRRGGILSISTVDCMSPVDQQIIASKRKLDVSVIKTDIERWPLK